jgi:hypothetical protein
MLDPQTPPSHDPEFVRDLAAELVAELTKTTSAIRTQHDQTWFPDDLGPGAGHR